MFDFLSEKFSSIFSRITGQSKLSEKNVEEALVKVKEALLEADVPYQVVDTFLTEVKNEVVGQKVLTSLKPGEQFIKIVHDKLVAFLGGKDDQAGFTFTFPSIVMLMGLQGSGKTTTIAKLANLVLKHYQEKGKPKKILAASVDFYRPAAIDQLEILAKQVGISFYRSSKTDPVAAAQDIAAYAKNGGFDLLFLDTAGRLHIDSAMLQELRDIEARLKPKHKLLVLDAMTGQESLKAAQAFDQAVSFDAAILTKLDSDTRGGAAFAFRYALSKPIAYGGIGEKIEDLEPFKPERAAGRILGMGDLASLVEKANQKIKISEQEALGKTMMSGKMTLTDFAAQIDMMNKLGSLTSVMKYLPGMGGQNISPEMMEKGEREMKKFKAIISSMTLKERIYPQVLNASRKQRIARGAGVGVADINVLLERFEQSQQFVKLLKKFGRFPGLK